MARVGELDRRITIERAGETGRNPLNEIVEDWAPLTTIWSRREDASDGERMTAGQVGAFLISRFVVRSSSVTKTVTASDRISYDGAVWNITGIKETRDGRNQYLEITASREAD